jgi:hypothetical protein
MAIINHCHFQLPPVNNNQEHLAFIIEGLDPSIILPNREEEIATQRELTAEIFRSFKQLHNLTFPHQQLPASINNIRDNLSTNSLISTCLFHPNESPTPWLGLVMASTNTTANELKEAITLLCVTHKHPLLIGGSKVNIKLHALPIDKTYGNTSSPAFQRQTT